MDRCAIFLDGGYLNTILRRKGGLKLDFKKLSEKLSGNMDRLRTYYYTSMPFQSSPPTDDEKRRYSKAHRFINQLKSIPRFEVKLGRLQKKTDLKGDVTRRKAWI